MQAATPISIERRFPLDLHPTDGAIRALYESAKAARWNPDSDLPWEQFAIDGAGGADLEAARRVWSRRAWVEYTGLAETPALLIRFCLELDREADPKYFLTVRNTEEAWHIEAFHRYAETCGGYFERPANAAWEPVFNRSLYRDALNAGLSLDAYVVTHCAFVDGLEYALAEAALSHTREPLAHAVLQRCLGDYRRHAEFGWLYAARRAAGMDAGARAAASDVLAAYITQVEFAGYHCAGLATAIDATAESADMDRVARAGLGAAPAAVETAVFREYLGRARARLAESGLMLPELHHPRLGAM